MGGRVAGRLLAPQLDVKFIQPLPGAPKAKKAPPFTAIDDCTRLRVLRITPGSTSRRPSSSWTTCWRGSRSGSRSSNAPEFGASFHWHVLDKGAGHVYIKPRTPRLNGKVERSHRPTAAWAARRPMRDSSSEPRPGCNPSPSLAYEASTGTGQRHTSDPLHAICGHAAPSRPNMAVDVRACVRCAPWLTAVDRWLAAPRRPQRRCLRT